jgi:hypothetical protein
VVTSAIGIYMSLYFYVAQREIEPVAWGTRHEFLDALFAIVHGLVFAAIGMT